jgi:IclR family acetate operon transcriptional repressor
MLRIVANDRAIMSDSKRVSNNAPNTARELRLSRSEALTRVLEDEIASERLPPGHRFGTRDQLRRRFNVAMATINETIRVLEMRKIVEARPGPGGGVFVASPTGAEELDEPAFAGSLRKALTILLAFRERQRITAAEAAAAARVAETDAIRLLALLGEHGLVAQEPGTETFRAGPDLVHLGLAVVRDLELRTHIHPFIEALSQELGETVHIVVREGRDVFFVDSVEGSHAVRAGSRTGRAMPAHATAAGKALLAELSTDEVRELYPAQRLARLLPATLATRSQLERALEAVRASGYATNLAETEPDLGVAAAVVRDSSGVARCAIGIAGPLSRVNEATIPELVKPLLRVAREASEALRYRSL